MNQLVLTQTFKYSADNKSLRLQTWISVTLWDTFQPKDLFSFVSNFLLCECWRHVMFNSAWHAHISPRSPWEPPSSKGARAQWFMMRARLCRWENVSCVLIHVLSYIFKLSRVDHLNIKVKKCRKKEHLIDKIYEKAVPGELTSYRGVR